MLSFMIVRTHLIENGHDLATRLWKGSRDRDKSDKEWEGILMTRVQEGNMLVLMMQWT